MRKRLYYTYAIINIGAALCLPIFENAFASDLDRESRCLRFVDSEKIPANIYKYILQFYHYGGLSTQAFLELEKRPESVISRLKREEKEKELPNPTEFRVAFGPGIKKDPFSIIVLLVDTTCGTACQEYLLRAPTHPEVYSFANSIPNTPYPDDPGCITFSGRSLEGLPEFKVNGELWKFCGRRYIRPSELDPQQAGIPDLYYGNEEMCSKAVKH